MMPGGMNKMSNLPGGLSNNNNQFGNNNKHFSGGGGGLGMMPGMMKAPGVGGVPGSLAPLNKPSGQAKKNYFGAHAKSMFS